MPAPVFSLRVICALLLLSVVPPVCGWSQSLPGSTGAKQAVKCQRTIGKADGKFVTERLKRLAGCSNAVLTCLQTKPADAKCLGKATGKCRKQLGAAGAPDALADTLEAAIVKACGSLSPADLLDPSVLGFANAAATCADLGVPALGTAADVARCLRLAHASLSERSYGVAAPRAGELAGQGGIDVSRVPDLPLFGGCGDCGAGSPATGKAVGACAAAIDKAGAAFVAGTRGALDKCTAAFVGCAQTNPGDAACRTKATATCQQVPTGLVKARAKLRAAVQKKCGALAFGILADPSGLHLGAVTCACQQVGVEPVLGLDDYAVCLARHHECALAALLPTVAPGLDALLAAQNLAVSDLLCVPAATAAAVARQGAPHAFAAPFGSIAKYLAGAFPAALRATRSPVASRGSRPRVGAPTSSKCSPAPGKHCVWSLPISKRPIFKNATRSTGATLAVDPPTLIVGVRRLDGEFVDDHFELALGDTSADSTVELELAYADDLASCQFELALSVMEDGEVASYTTIEQQPHLPPGNDACAAATVVDTNPYFAVLDTTAATRLDDEPSPSCATGTAARSVWYRFTPTATGIMTISTVGSTYDTVIGVFGGGCGGPELACGHDAASGVQLPIAAGTSYLIQVADDGDPAATSTLRLGFAFVPLAIGSPPTISNLVLGVPQVGSPLCPTIPAGTAFPMTITYADPTGNVKDGASAALALEHFEPSQREEYGIPTDAPVITGDGFNGTVSFGVCGLFTTDTVVSFKVNLVTIGGLSNQLIGALPKPPGAN